MSNRKQPVWWRVMLAMLLLVVLAGGLGLLLGGIVLGLRRVLDQPTLFIVGPPISLVVMYCYFRWVWIPIWGGRARHIKQDV